MRAPPQALSYILMNVFHDSLTTEATHTLLKLYQHPSTNTNESAIEV